MQNNQDPWLHLSRPEDIQEFTNQEHLLKAFLKTYESLDDRLSVTVTIKSTDGRDIPFVGSLNFNGVTVIESVTLEQLVLESLTQTSTLVRYLMMLAAVLNTSQHDLIRRIQ